MATLIEILSQDAVSVTAAFYYPIAPEDYLSSSDDQTRTPSGTRLSEAEKQALKDGTLYEFKYVLKRNSNESVNALYNKIEAQYNAKKNAAQATYQQQYGIAGTAFDGTDWT